MQKEEFRKVLKEGCESENEGTKLVREKFNVLQNERAE